MAKSSASRDGNPHRGYEVRDGKRVRNSPVTRSRAEVLPLIGQLAERQAGLGLTPDPS